MRKLNKSLVARLILRLILIPNILLFAACSGGSGGGSSSTITDNYSVSLSFPTVNADMGGVSQATITGKLVRSDGGEVAADDISFVSVNSVLATLNTADPTRWSVQIPLVVNSDTNLDVAVEYSDGSTDALNHQIKNSLKFAQISNLTLDVDNNRVLVLGSSPSGIALGAVDLDTGEISIISSTDRGTTLDVGADISIPIAVAIDSDNNRALLIQFGSSMILAIDLSSGDRSFFSTAGDLANPVSLIVDSENERALVVDNDLKAIIAIDFGTGARNIVSGALGGGLVFGDGPAFVDPKTIAFIENGFVLVMDAALDGALVPIGSTDPVNPLFEVNLNTGERWVISDNNITGTGPEFARPQAIGLDTRNPPDVKMLVFNNGNDSLYAVNEAGIRTVISGPGSTFATIVFGLVVDNAHQRVLLPSVVFGGLIAIDLNTGIRTAFAKTSTGAGEALNKAEKIALDSSNNRFFVLEDDAVVEVDLTMGDRTIFSAIGTGTGAAFLNL